MAYEPKLRDTIITDAGRHVFLSVGAGHGTLVYTRVIMSSQKMKDQNGQELPDETVRAITSLSDDLKEGVLQVTPVSDNTITVTGQFSNKDLANDLTFSTIGWYARIDTTDSKGVTTKGPEYLIAITPMVKDSEILAAGSPDHRSSQIISAELDMALSNAAKVDMTVNQIGYVTRAELNVWETTVKDNLDKKLADLENGLIANQRLVGLLSHDGRGLAAHDSSGFVATTQYLKIDKTLQHSEEAADAGTVGHKFATTEQEIEALQQGLANGQTVLQGIADNSYSVTLLNHDGSSLAASNGRAFLAKKRYFEIDPTLSKAGQAADAKATGSVIEAVFLALSGTLNATVAGLDIVKQQSKDITNRLMAVEDKIKNLSVSTK